MTKGGKPAPALTTEPQAWSSLVAQFFLRAVRNGSLGKPTSWRQNNEAISQWCGRLFASRNAAAAVLPYEWILFISERSLLGAPRAWHPKRAALARNLVFLCTNGFALS